MWKAFLGSRSNISDRDLSIAKDDEHENLLSQTFCSNWNTAGWAGFNYVVDEGARQLKGTNTLFFKGQSTRQPCSIDVYSSD
jgi:hypothetical protein